MEDKRPRISVEHSHKSLILVKKDASFHENPFFIQIVDLSPHIAQIAVRVDDGEYVSQEITRKDLDTLLIAIRDVLTNIGTVSVIDLCDNKVHILHFENGEIGVGIGKGKYVLEKDSAEVILTFCNHVIQ